MKGDMVIFVSLSLLLYWKRVDSMSIHLNFMLKEDASPPIQLNMAEESVDDMYFGCNDAMQKMVKNKYFEETYLEPFENAWKKAEQCAENKLKLRKNEGLTKDHLQAICAYTANDIYKMFNEAVQNNRTSYGSSFQFHTFHFLLTSAVQTLNSKGYCYDTLRRTHTTFVGQKDQTFRFGSFASSSYRMDQTGFGTETCFKIKTCAGAFLKDFSVYKEEAEVLIPPYEVFRIKQITNNMADIKALGVKSCKLVYIVESSGCKSNLNCKVVHI